MRIVIATAAIRARFAAERPAVHEDEWDERDYLRQRQAAYLEAFSLFAADTEIRFEVTASAANAESGVFLARCPVSEDTVFLEPANADGFATEAVRTKLVQAARRVFADASAWRRSLRAPYFARHREWRARVGSPIQH